MSPHIMENYGKNDLLKLEFCLFFFHAITNDAEIAFKSEKKICSPFQVLRAVFI